MATMYVHCTNIIILSSIADVTLKKSEENYV